MEVKDQFISALDSLTCAEGKQRERMAELQERRRSLQALLSARLAELKRICLQEAELTGTVPDDLSLENGEKPLFVRRRGGAYCQGNRKSRAEEEECQLSRLKKTLFSGTLRKHSDSEHSTHTLTHTHHGKRTVHRGCHTDDTVRSESSSVADSTGNNNVDVFYQNKARRNSLLNRINHLETLPPNKPLPQLPTHHPPLSQDSSTGPSDFGHTANGTILVNGARGSSSSDILLDNINTSKEVLFRGTAPAGTCQSTEIITVGQAKLYNGPSEVGGQGGGVGRGSGHAEVLLDYVWDQGRLSSLHSHLAEPRQVKVTRTKSCGPFLPGQQKQQPKDQNFSQSTILPDTKSHPMPPIPSKLPPNQNAQLEEATRSLHKALALEGLRDWYLRNTVGSFQQIHNNGKPPFGFTSGLLANVNGCVKGQSERGTALQQRVTNQGVIHPAAYSTEMNGHTTLSHHQQKLPHSATFHGHQLHGRSVDTLLNHDSFPPQQQEVDFRESFGEQLSPGTLV
uniref:Uncharacterized LOC103384393 n=1 Tax=Cynoglossus semilaevis TaxID=244447 RepID=A0A3P8WKI7_CYNSE